MKIKTIRNRLDNAQDFDQELNTALADGYQLVRRDVIPGFRLDGGNYLHNMLYAELVQLDPEPDPEAQPLDPMDAVYAIKATCDAMPLKDCQGGRCPLYVWCCQLEGGRDPSDWDLPKKEAPEA